MTLTKLIKGNLFNVLLKALAAGALVLVGAGLLPAQVIDYEIDPTFNSAELFQKGSVSDIEILSNQEYLIVGSFNNFDSPVSAGAIINNAGTLNVLMNYGGPYVSRYDNSFLQHGSVLRKYSQSGIDNSFYFEFRKQAYEGFVPDQEIDVLVTSNGNILVAGVYFTDSTDISTNSLRQLCMVDATGAPVPDFPMVKCEPFDARIYSIDTLSTGEYIIAGSFTHVNGHPANNIAKLHADFTVDTGFGNPLNDGGTAFLELIDSEDRIWFAVPGGEISSQPGINPSIVRVLSNGNLDDAFTVPEILVEVDDFIHQGFASTILEDTDDTFILGGFFIEYNGTPKNSIIKINDDGSLIEDAFPNLGTDEAEWDGGFYSEYPGITTVKKLPDGKLLLGGRFSSFGGEPYSCLVRLQPSGYVGVYERGKLGTFRVYPNPADGFVTVDYSFVASSQNTVLNVFDYLGRKVYSEVLGANVEGQTVIDTKELPNGVYVLEVLQDGVQVETNKMVIGH